MVPDRRNNMSARERRQAIRVLRRYMIGWMVGAVVLSMVVAYSVQLRNDTSAVALQRALGDHDPAIRERTLHRIARDSLEERINCAALVAPILDSVARVRSAAMPVVTKSLSGDRCHRQIFAALDTSPLAAGRILLLQAIAASGRPAGKTGHTALLRALGSDSATRGYAAIALTGTADNSPSTLRALRQVFRSSTGTPRGEALLALLSLEPLCHNERLVEQGFQDADSEVRIMAMQAWQMLINNPRNSCRRIPTALQSLVHDPEWRVRANAARLVLDHGTVLQHELLRPLLADSIAEVRETVNAGLARLRPM